MSQEQHIVQTTAQQHMLSLYDKYSAMLFGYILEVVKDAELAEKYMVSVFKGLTEPNTNRYPTDNTWLLLQQIAKIKLADFTNSVQDCNNYAQPYLNKKNSALNLMSDAQKNVFCAVYYHGKTTGYLAEALNEPELNIRKTLKEAFAIIRQQREH